MHGGSTKTFDQMAFVGRWVRQCAKCQRFRVAVARWAGGIFDVPQRRKAMADMARLAPLADA